MLTITIFYLSLEFLDNLFFLIILKRADKKNDTPFYIMLTVVLMALFSRWYPEYNTVNNIFLYLSYVLLPFYIFLRIKAILKEKK